MAKNQALAPAPPDSRTARPQGSPLPRIVYRIANPLIGLLLRSPAHRLLSNALMLLTYQGRKTGQRYTLPVGYLQQGSRLLLFTHGAWWKNLRGGAPVAVRLRGRLLRGTAMPVEDAAEASEGARALVQKRGERMARRMGLLSPGDDPAAPHPRPGTTLIKIALEERA